MRGVPKRALYTWPAFLRLGSYMGSTFSVKEGFGVFQRGARTLSVHMKGGSSPITQGATWPQLDSASWPVLVSREGEEPHLRGFKSGGEEAEVPKRSPVREPPYDLGGRIPRRFVPDKGRGNLQHLVKELARAAGSLLRF